MAATATGTITALWDLLYNWMHGVLPSVQICESHENAPTPRGNFISVEYAGNWQFAGTAPSKMVDGREDLPSPRLYVYRGSVQVRDVDGNGENLLALIESLDTEPVLQMFGDAGVSVLRTTGPVAMPALQQTCWRRESILTLEMSWARAYTGSDLTIESVEISRVDVSGTIDSENEIIVDDKRNVLQSEEILNKFIIETTEAPNGT